MSSPATPPSRLAGRLRTWLSHDAHPLVQFIKYGFAGGCAALTYVLTIGGLTNTVFPTEGEGIDAFRRGLHYFLALTAGFITSNAVGYVLNVAFVFKPGRHRKRTEVLLFLGLAGLAWVLTAPAGSWAMGRFPDLNKWVPALLTAVVSALINYTGRKFFIFLK
jgi:putative flippase GtrA